MKSDYFLLRNRNLQTSKLLLFKTSTLLFCLCERARFFVLSFSSFFYLFIFLRWDIFSRARTIKLLLCAHERPRPPAARHWRVVCVDAESLLCLLLIALSCDGKQL